MTSEHRDIDAELAAMEARQTRVQALALVRIGNRSLRVTTNLFAILAEEFDALTGEERLQVLQMHTGHMVALHNANQEPGATLPEQHRMLYLQVFGLEQTESRAHQLRIAPETIDVMCELPQPKTADPDAVPAAQTA